MPLSFPNGVKHHLAGFAHSKQAHFFWGRAFLIIHQHMEHTAQNPVLMADMVATIADAGTCAPLVRIPGNSVEWFKWALDAGAWGVVVPMVNTREEAQRAVEHAKYPPAGSRSIGGAFGPYGFGITDWRPFQNGGNLAACLL